MQNTTQESESTSSESQESPSTSPEYAYQSDPLYLRQGYDLTSPFGEMVQTFLRIIHRQTLSDISDDEMTLDKEEEVFREEIGWSEADEMDDEAIWSDEDIEVIRNVKVEEQEVEMREWSTGSEREEGEEEMEYEGGEEIDEEGYLGWDEGQGMRGEWVS